MPKFGAAVAGVHMGSQRSGRHECVVLVFSRGKLSQACPAACRLLLGTARCVAQRAFHPPPCTLQAGSPGEPAGIDMRLRHLGAATLTNSIR